MFWWQNINLLTKNYISNNNSKIIVNRNYNPYNSIFNKHNFYTSNINLATYNFRANPAGNFMHIQPGYIEDFWGKLGIYMAQIFNCPVQQHVVYDCIGLNIGNVRDSAIVQHPFLTQNNSFSSNIPIKQATKNAVDTILTNFDSLGLPEEVKDYISNIEFKEEPFGTARADIENGKIIVNLSNENVNPTDMVKLLIHESLHCVNKSPFSSVEEEFNCEKQAVQTTAKLIAAGQLEDFEIYNHSMKKLGAKENEAMLDASLKSWLNAGGYDNRILDSAGNVNIEQYEIHNGDVIKINGKEYGTIGEYFLEGMQSSNICQLFSIGSNNKANVGGIVVFDDTTQTAEEKQRFLQQTNNPQRIEIVRNGEFICTGTVYNAITN